MGSKASDILQLAHAIRRLLVSPHGRIGRSLFWLGMLVSIGLLSLGLPACAALEGHAGTPLLHLSRNFAGSEYTFAFGPISAACSIFAWFIAFNVTTKRLHDLCQPAYSLAIIPMMVQFVPVWPIVISMLTAASLIAFVIICGFQKGLACPNEWGAEPREVSLNTV